MAVNLRGSTDAPTVVGARVEIHLEGPRGRVLVRTYSAGSGFLAQRGPWMHFGLGQAVVERVLVHWPGGEVEEVEGLSAGQFWLVKRGTGRGIAWAPPSIDSGAGVANTEEIPQGSLPQGRLPLAVPVPMPSLAVTDLEGTPGSFLGITPGGAQGTGWPLLITLWSESCAECIKELSALAANQPVLEQVGLRSILLSTDDYQNVPAVKQALQRAGVGGQHGFAAEECTKALGAFSAIARNSPRAIATPISFLIGPHGYLQVVYEGAVSIRQVVQDLRLIELDPNARRMAAVPFPGRFLSPAPEANLRWWRTAMLRRGLTQIAKQFALGELTTEVLGEAQMHRGFGEARLQQGMWQDAESHFLKATRLNPADPLSWLGLGQARLRAGQLQDAEEALVEALRLGADDRKTEYEWGLLLVARRDHDRFETHLLRLRTAFPDLVEPLQALWDQGGKE